VVIEGPKACGKTRQTQQLAASTVVLDVDTAARQLDGWQVEPALWNQVRRAVDAVKAPEQFLLTCSAVLAGKPPSCADPGLSVADLAELVCRGGGGAVER
jgi:uncharacterized protein